MPGDAFSPAEIEVARQFVADGGGLCLLGLGWSWEPYNPGTTLDDYPMTRLGAPYGIWWGRQIIYDPTDQENGDPRFHVFYPQAAQFSLEGAEQTLTAAHLAHGAGLPEELENDAALRTAVLDAHAILAAFVRDLTETHSAHAGIFDFYTALTRQWPDYYARRSGVDAAQFPHTVITRERSWATLREVLPPTAEGKARMIAAGQLFGRYRDLLDDFGLVLLDNVQLAPTQLDYIHRILSLIPAGLHNLRSVSVFDFLSTPAFPEVGAYLERGPGSVNIFGFGIEEESGNSFPEGEVPPGLIAGFCAVVAHEFNHIVEAFRIQGTPVLQARQSELIDQAGVDHLNYLRSMFEDGFFVDAPQEFFASISNQWFTDSAKTLELGVLRFQAGRPEPLNQALFFAEVYSQGGANTWFYFGDSQGALERRSIPLTRDGNGRINSLTVGPRTYSFVLDSAGNVIDLTLSNPPAQTFQIWPSPARVRENRAGLALVQLATAPASNVVVSIAKTSGDANVALTAGASLTFTPGNWNFPQNISFFAAPDADVTNGSATFVATAAGIPNQTFTVTEMEDDFPAVTLQPPLAAGRATVLYQRSKALDDIVYAVEISTDLYVWNSDPTLTEQTILSDDGVTQLVRARVLQPFTGNRIFLRLRLRR